MTNQQSKAKSRRRSVESDAKLIEKKLITSVPINMAVEKLRGFVADHKARITAVDGNQISLEIEVQQTSRLRRITDRPATFIVDLLIEEERFAQKQRSPQRVALRQNRRPRVHHAPKSPETAAATTPCCGPMNSWPASAPI